MRTVLVALCLLAVVYCQTQNKNGNPTGEIGQPAFDEIVVASTLTVRGKSGSRGGKSLITDPKPIERTAEENKDKVQTADGVSVSSTRKKRAIRSVLRNKEVFSSGPFGSESFGTSSSASHASSNAFNSYGPFGSFGASSSQSATNFLSIGTDGIRGSSGFSVAQTYNLPNGNKISLSASNSINHKNGKPSASENYSLTITTPDGKVHTVHSRATNREQHIQS